MGEVYSAKDTRLDRTVAIKLLPPHLAGDEQLRARFEREAKAVSSLNHPHICTLHDVGHETIGKDELHYLVLEMIEGESLADRLAKGPLPLEEVLRYGAQIASALDAAHKQGIIHRDLKPGNVMITKAGAKLLDFGLAGTDVAAGVGEVLSTLRTVDKPLTEHGTILGTFQYMAPEQLEGQAADARTDIFALGALLYEMATGRRAFLGQTRTSLIAAIVSSQPPPISSVQEMSPPALDHVIRKCLEKDPEDRWQSARDVMAELRWIAEGGSRIGLPAVVIGRRRVRERTAWAAFALASLAALGFGIAWARRAPKPPALVRFTVAMPEGVSAVGPPALSPDGRKLAFDAGEPNGRRQIWVRSLDQLEARALPGTEGALRPIWSPDSRFVAFMAGGKLRKVDVAGGPPQTICDAPTGADGSWSPEGVILFDGRGSDPIWRVPAAGGVAKPEVEVGPDKRVTGAGWPHFLPDGRHFLYLTSLQSTEDQALMVKSLGANDSRELLKTSSLVHYAPPGYLLYVREQTLVAQAFDAGSLQIEGEPVPLGEGLGVNDRGARVLLDLRHRRSRLPGRSLGRAAAALVRQGRQGDPRPRGGRQLRGRMALSGRQAPRFRHDQGRGGRRHLDPGRGARRVVALHLRRGGRDRPGLVAGRPKPRLLGAAQERRLDDQGRRGHARGRGPARERTRTSTGASGRGTGSTCSTPARARRRAGTCGRCR